MTRIATSDNAADAHSVSAGSAVDENEVEAGDVGRVSDFSRAPVRRLQYDPDSRRPQGQGAADMHSCTVSLMPKLMIFLTHSSTADLSRAPARRLRPTTSYRVVALGQSTFLRSPTR